MHVRINDVTDGRCCAFLYRAQQRATRAKRTATIDNGNAAFPNNESDIGAIASIGMIKVNLTTRVDEDPIGNFDELKFQTNRFRGADLEYQRKAYRNNKK